MTQLASALRAAGIATIAERLRDIATAALIEHADSRAAAAQAVCDAVQSDAALQWGLFASYRDLAVRRLLGEIESEMRRHEREHGTARAGGQGDHASQQKSAPSVSHGGGHSMHANHSTVAPASPPDRRAAQASVANVLRLTMLDTFQIDGTPIGDVSAGAARSWARREGRHVRWVQMLTANVPADDPIRRWITPDDADELWRRSAQESDA